MYHAFVRILIVLTQVGASDARMAAVAQNCLKLSPATSVGGIAAPEESTFGDVLDLAVRSDGGVYVADLHPQSIKRFGPDGAFLHHLGREGEGPGEFRSLLGIELLPGDTLAVLDYGNRRISFFAPDGDFLDDIAVPGAAYGANAFSVDGEGRMYVLTRTMSLHPGDVSYQVIDRRGNVVDTLHYGNPEIPSGFFAETHAGTMRSFPDEAIVDVSAEGQLLVAQTSGYRIVEGAGGDTLIARHAEQLPLEGEERRNWEALRTYYLGLGRGAVPPLPRSKPIVRTMFVDGSGQIWVRPYGVAERRDVASERRTRSDRQQPAIVWLEANTWDIFTMGGEFVRCVRLPWNVKFLEAYGRTVWGVTRGDYEVEGLVRWELP